MTGCQWHQPDHVQVICTSLQTDNHASTPSPILVINCVASCIVWIAICDCCRYKKIRDANKQTGRGKSNWDFMDALRPILDRDPAVNPPCVVSAGCVAAVDVREQDVSHPQVSDSGSTTPQISGSGTTTATSKRGSRKRKTDSSNSLDRFTEEANKRHENIVAEMKALVQEERRKNDLFEKFLDTLSKK